MQKTLSNTPFRIMVNNDFKYSTLSFSKCEVEYERKGLSLNFELSLSDIETVNFVTNTFQNKTEVKIIDMEILDTELSDKISEVFRKYIVRYECVIGMIGITNQTEGRLLGLNPTVFLECFPGSKLNRNEAIFVGH